MRCANCDYSIDNPPEWDPLSSYVIDCPSCKVRLNVRVGQLKLRIGPKNFFYTTKAEELKGEKQERDSNDS